MFPAQKLSRTAGTSSASVYGSAPMISSETGVGKFVMLQPEITVEERGPEVEVLLPERDVEPERLGVVARQRLGCARLSLHAREQPLDRVARA